MSGTLERIPEAKLEEMFSTSADKIILMMSTPAHRREFLSMSGDMIRAAVFQLGDSSDLKGVLISACQLLRRKAHLDEVADSAISSSTMPALLELAAASSPHDSDLLAAALGALGGFCRNPRFHELFPGDFAFQALWAATFAQVVCTVHFAE